MHYGKAVAKAKYDEHKKENIRGCPKIPVDVSFVFSDLNQRREDRGSKAKDHQDNQHERHHPYHIFLHCASSFVRIFRILFSALLLGSISSCPQPQQRSLMSMPTRRISHRTEPQGCGFFNSTVSCRCRSMLSSCQTSLFAAYSNVINAVKRQIGCD